MLKFLMAKIMPMSNYISTRTIKFQILVGCLINKTFLNICFRTYKIKTKLWYYSPTKIFCSYT